MRSTPFTVAEFFERERRYVVPLFQRPYVWSEEIQWSALWEDITNKANELLDPDSRHAELSKHFLGAAVLHKMETFGKQIAAQEVIDGQQRLTTLQVVLLALRDVAAALQNNEAAQRLHRLTVHDGRMDQAHEKYKVWPTTADQKDMEAIFAAKSAQDLEAKFPRQKIPRTQRFASRPRLVDAYIYFYKSAQEFVQNADTETGSVLDASEKIDALTDAITKYMHMVIIELEQGDDPQVIFETLNARGEPLLPSDLIRNFVFMEAGRRGENVEQLHQQYWEDFDKDSAQFWKQEERQGRLKRPRIDLFMFHYLVYRTGGDLLITNLFQSFRRWWNSLDKSTRVEDVLQDIRLHSDIYRQFFTNEAPSRLNLFVHRLRIMDTSTVYPVLLYLYGNESNVVAADREQIIIDLESYLLRRMVCQLTSKNYNRHFLALLKAMRNAERVDREMVRAFLIESKSDTTRWPGDNEFELRWMTLPIYQRLTQARVNMVLAALDLQLETNKQEQMHIDTSLSIEHVWPQNPASEQDWPPAKNRDLIHSFGNLTLLTQPLNSSVRNGPFSRKRPEITGNSRLRLNAYFQGFNDADRWTEEQIQVRGHELFNIAQTIWPSPVIDVPIVSSAVEETEPVEADQFPSPQEQMLHKYQHIYEYLIQAARDETLVPYHTVSAMAGLSTDMQIDRNELGRILGAISEYENDHGRPLLSAVAVLANEGVPSPGFYNLARDLGCFSSSGEMDELDFWSTELKKLYQYWQNH